MHYEEALAYIHSTHQFGKKLGLENFKVLLACMGNPQDKLRYIHIAGTNGKGSTASFIHSMLLAANYNAGLYTSPYLERFNERMRAKHSLITDEELAHITAFVQEKANKMMALGYAHPSEFEIVTAIGFQYFYQKGCDPIVLEVGMGGRLDATNVIQKALVSVITTISLDHMQYLGSTLSAIAAEKAGIIKQKGTVVIYPQTPEVLETLLQVCKERAADYTIVDKAKLLHTHVGESSQSFDYKGISYTLGLMGAHQIWNAATALEAVAVLHQKGYVISETQQLQGLANAKWPGRCEILSRDPLILIDGSHNEEGAKALAADLERRYADIKKVFLLGLLNDKAIENLVSVLGPLGSDFYTTTPLPQRSFPCTELAALLKNQFPDTSSSAYPDIAEAFQAALSKVSAYRTEGSTAMVIVCGSLYLVGEIRRRFTSL